MPSGTVAMQKGAQQRFGNKETQKTGMSVQCSETHFALLNTEHSLGSIQVRVVQHDEWVVGWVIRLLDEWPGGRRGS